METSKIYVAIMIFTFSFGCNAWAGDFMKADETPESALTAFYACISSEETNCSRDIIRDIESAAREIKADGRAEPNNNTDSDIVWKFLLEHKKLFLYEYIKPTETLEKARMYYAFSKDKKCSVIYDGPLSIIVSSPLEKGGSSGVLKEITFPIYKDDSYGVKSYKIILSGITVNGFSVLSKPSGDDTEIIKRLGF